MVAADPAPRDQARYHEVKAQRAYDSRAVRSPLGPGQTRTLKLGGSFGIPASGVSAVAVNLTAVSPTATTWLTAYRAGTPRPGIASVYAPARTTRATMSMVPVEPRSTPSKAAPRSQTREMDVSS